MKLAIYLALGGVAGTLARYLLGTWLQPPGSGFPWGTLVINIVGSFLLGILMRYLFGSAQFSPEIRAGLTVGFCGAFTTMSTFAFETVALMQDGHYARAGTYLVVSTAGSVLAAFGGLALGARLL